MLVQCLFFISDLTILAHCSFDGQREAFYARLLNSITSKSFIILHTLTYAKAMAGTFILLAQALLQASALIGLQKAFVLQFMVGTTNGVNAVENIVVPCQIFGNPRPM